MDERLSKDGVRQVLSQVGPALRAVLQENARLTTKLAAVERSRQAEEVVTMMDARGLSDRSVPFQQRVAALVASGKDLAIVKEAASMATPDMSFASLSDIPDDSTNTLEDYLTSGR